MSDLAQDIQQAENKDSETTTDTQTNNLIKTFLETVLFKTSWVFPKRLLSCKAPPEKSTCNTQNELQNDGWFDSGSTN